MDPQHITMAVQAAGPARTETLMGREFRVLPAHAWQAFFPDLQGSSAGTIFEIKP